MTGSSDNEELTLFNELVTNWFDAGGFDACDREEQHRRSKIITSIRRKLLGRCEVPSSDCLPKLT